MIWRDDDIAANTRIPQLEAVDDLFQRYRVTHTIAVIAKGIEKRKDLLAFIRERRMDVQLHCWEHVDLTESKTLHRDLAVAVHVLEQHFVRPKVLYPPWNRTSTELEMAAADHGLLVSTRKVSLAQYIRCDGDVDIPVVNFHFWSREEFPQLEQALEIWARPRIPA